MHANYFRAGGVHQDIPVKVLADIGDLARHAHAACSRTRFRLVADNRIFKQRNVDIGTVTKEDALRLGLLRPDDPRRRHPVGPAQVAALRGL